MEYIWAIWEVGNGGDCDMGGKRKFIASRKMDVASTLSWGLYYHGYHEAHESVPEGIWILF